MKKKTVIRIVICAALAVLLIAGGVTWSFLPHPISYPIRSIEPVGSSLRVLDETEDSVTVQPNHDGDVRVMLFTDLHLDGKNKTSKQTVSHLVENIRREKPDLVLLGGDNVTSGMNRIRCRQLGRIFEQLGVYWAGVLGNHEGDNKFSVTRAEMTEIFSSYAHCLMRNGPAQIDGNCNYALQILNRDGSMMQTFFCLDSFDRLTAAQKAQYGYAEDERPYDGVHENQIAWYSEKVKDVKSEYGEYSSIVLLHIPTPQYAEAAEKGVFLYGDQHENVCCSAYETGLFDAVKASGTTKAVFCGHDHLNNFGASYKGVLLSYIEPSGYGSYSMIGKEDYTEDQWLQGYTMLTLHTDGTFTPVQMRNVALD